MKKTEFCYWLQGAFEICQLSIIDPWTQQMILNHLNLVFKYDKKGLLVESHTSSFCFALKGLLEYSLSNHPSYKGNLLSKVVEDIKKDLAKCFKHEIDNATYGTQKEDIIESSAIHSGMPYSMETDTGDFIARC